MYIGDFYFELPKELMQLDFVSIYYVLFCLIVFFLSRPFKAILRPYVICIANIVFIYSFGIMNFQMIGIVFAISYLFGILIDKLKFKKTFLAISVILLLYLLFMFKYPVLLVYDKFYQPLGLSFFLFKALSYLFDVKAGKILSVKNPILLFDYLFYFPTMIAGPINRINLFINEIKSKYRFDYKDAKAGGFQLVLGIYEKMVICDYFSAIVAKTLDNPEITGWNLLFGIILYSFQIYLDFDSLSNIAIGSSRLLGIHLPDNFRSPYLAINLKDFWRRWHISLSSWFRDYLYIPLGGNRKGAFIQALNLVIVFIASGLWHGNTLNFLLWGLLHGLIQVVENMIGALLKFLHVGKKITIAFSPLLILINFTIVTALWLIFRYPTMGEVSAVVQRLQVAQPFSFELIGMTLMEQYWLYVLLAIVIITDILRYFTNVFGWFNKMFFPLRWAVYFTMMVTFMVFAVYGKGGFDPSDFIYRWF